MNNLQEILYHIKSDNVLIRMHNFPDPDAIASAYGLQKLMKIVNNIDSIICYKGKIDKYSTIRMFTELNIEITDVNDLHDIDKNMETIIVDTQRGNSNIDCFESENIICIDHHPTYKSAEYLYSDIRSNVGACSSIIAEYFFENDIMPDKSIATALLYGIKIDTANLTRGVSKLDLDMFYLLYNKSDLAVINSLESSTLQIDDLSSYSNAFNSIKIYNTIGFASTGGDSPEAIIAMISDFILSIDTVRFSVVYSIKTEGIRISVRSEYNCYDAGKVANIALKKLGSGGGGHQFMAGGFVSFAENDISQDELIEKIKESFIQAIEETTC